MRTQQAGLISDESISGEKACISTSTSPANNSGIKALNVSISAGTRARVAASRTMVIVPPVEIKSTLLIVLFDLCACKGTTKNSHTQENTQKKMPDICIFAKKAVILQRK